MLPWVLYGTDHALSQCDGLRRWYIPACRGRRRLQAGARRPVYTGLAVERRFVQATADRRSNSSCQAYDFPAAWSLWNVEIIVHIRSAVNPQIFNWNPSITFSNSVFTNVWAALIFFSVTYCYLAMLFYGWSYKALLRELQCVLLIFEPEKNTSPNLFSRTVRKHRKSDLSFFAVILLTRRRSDRRERSNYLRSGGN